MMIKRAFSITRSILRENKSVHECVRKLSDRNFKLKLDKLSPDNRQLVQSMMRVNQAGELGAVRIYQGQLFALNRTSSAPLLKEMLDQETVHRDTFNRIIGANNIRPTFFTPLWHVAGFSLGAVTALMGKETAMLCTEAVETEIGRHYNDQLRKLIEIVNEMECDVNQGNHSEGKEELEILKEVIKTFRDEELEHLDHAVENDSRSAPLHGLLTSVIQTGCKVAIKISERI